MQPNHQSRTHKRLVDSEGARQVIRTMRGAIRYCDGVLKELAARPLTRAKVAAPLLLEDLSA